MSEFSFPTSSFPPGLFQKAVERELALTEQVQFDSIVLHDNATQDAAVGTWHYKRLGGDWLKDTQKGDWIKPILPLFFIALTLILLLQIFNLDGGAGYSLAQPEYTIPPSSPQGNSAADYNILAPSLSDDITRSQHTGDNLNLVISSGKVEINRKFIEKRTKRDIVDTKKPDTNSPRNYGNLRSDEILTLNNNRETVYIQREEKRLAHNNFYLNRIERHCDLYRVDKEFITGQILDSNLLKTADGLNHNTLICIPAITPHSRPVNETRVPDPYVIRLLLSSFR